MEKEIEYGMVDLGLPSGLKWADRNVGAERPEAYGDYFMWGSTEPGTDKSCDWAYAPFNGGSSEFDKEYFNAHMSEWLIDEGVLKSEYDAAHVNMGGSWRMPTETEIRELLDGTTRSVEEVNGVKGVRFISKVKGNSIFMPLAGYRNGSDIYLAGYCGYAWSSSLDSVYAFYSRYLDFSNGGDADVSYDTRCFWFVVRGVHE